MIDFMIAAVIAALVNVVLLANNSYNICAKYETNQIILYTRIGVNSNAINYSKCCNCHILGNSLHA